MSITLTALQKQRTDTAANWTSANPTLLSGELGFESDTGKMKLGNGSTAWNSLAYLILIPSSGVYPGTQLIMPIGTAGAPPLTFTGDINTGIYSPGADQVAISTGGSGRLFVDASGRVGVGATPAAANFEVSQSGTASASDVLRIYNRTDGTSTGYLGLPKYGSTASAYGPYSANNVGINAVFTQLNIGTETAHALAAYTNNTERLRITSAGLVGVGTSSPSTRLEVQDNNTLISLKYASDAGSALLSWKNTAGTTLWSIGGGIATAQDELAFVRQGTTVAKFDSSGRLGIGTTTVSQLLHVHAGYQLITNSTTGTSSGLLIGLDTGDAVVSNQYAGALKFGTSNGEKARIDSSGRLLVGTSSGTGGREKLQVMGHASDATASGEITLAKGSSVSSGDLIGLINFTSSTNQSFATIGAFADATTGTNDYPGRLVFSTTADGASSPTERMRIAANGDIIFRNLPTVYPFTDNAVQLGGGGTRFTALYAVNGTIQTSDQREKTEITDSLLGSDFIKSLRPVSYKWIEGGNQDTGERDEQGNYIYKPAPGVRTHWGFVAQEVKQAIDAAGVDFGGWVLIDKDDPDSQQALRYDQFIAPLTKALQEALAEIDLLKAKVAALESA